jgi:hypothetical protein
MNTNYYLTPLSFLKSFDNILERLAQDKRNINLDEAIISWCIELSLEKYFPKVSQEIIENKNQWIQHSAISNITLKLYRNFLVITDKKIMGGFGNSLFNRLNNISRQDFSHIIQETKKEMNAKSIVFVAFVFTGIGLLLFLLNKKDNNNIKSNIQIDKDKFILPMLLINFIGQF